MKNTEHSLAASKNLNATPEVGAQAPPVGRGGGEEGAAAIQLAVAVCHVTPMWQGNFATVDVCEKVRSR